MATVDDLVNRALSRLAMPRVSSISEDSPQGRAANSAWPIIRPEVLRLHPWNCVTQRAVLVEPASVAISAATVGAGPAFLVTVDCGSAHGRATNDRVRIENVAGMTQLNGTWFVAVTDNDSFTLKDGNLAAQSGSGWGTYTSGGTVTRIPAWDYDRFFSKPASCLRILETEADEWAVEGDFVVANHGPTLRARYIKDETDPSKYEAALFSAMADRLAWEMAEELPGFSPDKLLILRERWERSLLAAQMAESQEQSAQDFAEDDWITVRY